MQEDIHDRLMHMLSGALDALVIGDPWGTDVDVSPVIDGNAQADIMGYIEEHRKAGTLIKTLPAPNEGTYVTPAIVKVGGIANMDREIFGPVLHVATFKARNIDNVVNDINDRQNSLTFGLHTRIDDRVEQILDRIEVGNCYVNRNQIGAIVGSQPFGGEGLSGTGPKAGGPLYLTRFRRIGKGESHEMPNGPAITKDDLEDALGSIDARNWAARLDRVHVLRTALSGKSGVVRKALTETAGMDMSPQSLPGPTGESNRLRMFPRGNVLCLGPTSEIALAQAAQALGAGCGAVVVAPGASDVTKELVTAGVPIVALNGVVDPEILQSIQGFAVVAAAGKSDWTRDLRIALSQCSGAIIPLVTETVAPERYVLERHLCIDTTAAGGNASLLASST